MLSCSCPSLVPLARSALSIVSSEAERKGLALSFDSPSDLPPLVMDDEDRLRQVLLNLPNDAFTPSGRVTLRLRTGQARRPAGGGAEGSGGARFA